MGKRRRARELAVQVQFHLEYSPGDPGKAFDLICGTFAAGKSIRDFSKQLVVGAAEKKKEIEQLISRASRNWRLDRMSRVDRCILRLAVYEMAFVDDVPPRVSIDEAVELGKRFGSEDSAGFINGVLDNIYNTLVREGRIEDEVS